MLIGAACSVQFSGGRALMLRLVAVGDPDPYNDWIWITGYVLDSNGLATAKRELYVMRAGLVVQRPTAPGRGDARCPRRAGVTAGQRASFMPS